MLKKVLVTFAVGEMYSNVEAVSGRFRRAYAEKNGWDYKVITDVPPGIKELGIERACFLNKLRLPSLLKDYDLAVFMDCDSVVNPLSPCLSEYEPVIPFGGFAGAQTVSPKSRKLVFTYWENYYERIRQRTGLNEKVVDPDLDINAGLLLFRPAQVAERWLELAQRDLPYTGEERLNLFELQRGRCYLLPSSWHILWHHHKEEYYPFILKRAKQEQVSSSCNQQIN